MRYISKRASSTDDLKAIVFSLWKDDRGPFENILGLASYTMPFITGLGWAVFIIEKVASLFGYGASDFGKWIDKELNLGPGSDIGPEHERRLQEVLIRKTSSMNDQFVKNAIYGSGSILKLIGGVPRIIKAIFTIIKMLLLALGFEKIRDIYTENKKKLPVDMAKKMLDMGMSDHKSMPMPTNILTQNLMGNNTNTILDEVKKPDIPINPMALINMFK